MLSWISGTKGAEWSPVKDFDTVIEAPETPAPVFAVRAFKQAIFGTPKPSEPIHHFDDIANQMPPTSPKDGQPQPVPDKKLEAIKNMPLPDNVALSPTKPNGILMTPGTTRRNKTVSFGAGIPDNEGKKVSRSGLPNSCPGKFPSPWTPKTDALSLSETPSTAGPSSQKRTKLTQTLHDVRDSSRNTATTTVNKDPDDVTVDFAEPRADSGVFWKTAYESYAANTQRDVKKLLQKQKAAKHFARQKHSELVNVSARLEREQAKSARLEAKVRDLERDMLEMKAKLQQDAKAPSERVQSAQDEAAKLRLENWKLREELERSGKASATSPRKSTSTGHTDIWTNPAPSSPFVADVLQRSVSHNSPSRSSALRPRDLNTLDAYQPQTSPKREKRTVDVSPQRSQPRATPRSSRNSEIIPDDSIDMDALPQPSPGDTLPRMPRSSKRVERSSVDLLVDKYSPTKAMGISSSPPQFDRMTMPIRAASVNNVAGPLATNSTKVREVKSNDMLKPVGGGDGKRVLSAEQRLAAMERIAARKAAKAM